MTTSFRFDGKRVLVTGAGKGIGRGIAKMLAECGAEVVALSRTQADLDSLRDEVIRDTGGKAPDMQLVCVELADWDATRKAIGELGHIHLLVNNASVLYMEPFMTTSKDCLENSFSINVNATVNVSQVVAQGMIERGEGGSIVIMSSIGSDMAMSDLTAYCGTKAAQDGIMHVMAKELGPHKIRVNSVHPTAVMTPMGRFVLDKNPHRPAFLARHPIGKFADIEDIVQGTLFLLSDQAAMITGTTLTIDGGFMTN